MKPILIIILSFFCLNSSSQTIDELEHELSFYNSGEEWGNKKEIAYKLLELDKLNEEAIDYLVEVFGRKNQRDSIKILFDKLIKISPNNPNIYLIKGRKRNAYFAGLTFMQKINCLKKAKELDENNIEANYSLGKIYYEQFVKEFKTRKRKEKLVIYAKCSIYYLKNLCLINDKFKETIKYPLIQLYNYLGNKSKSNELKMKNYQSLYFPISAFAGLPKGWDKNYSLDIISPTFNSFAGIESAIFHIKWYSKHLESFDEPILNDSLYTKIYRFTYLPTFKNPITIRIENKNDSVSIYWKISNGFGGYEPGEITKNESKKLTLNDWELIESKINSINFWKLPTTDEEFIGLDGSQFILEGKIINKYHVVDRHGGYKIYLVCKELINLTDLKLENLDIPQIRN